MRDIGRGLCRALRVTLGLALVASPAHAHLLPKQNATLNIIDRAAFCVVSVPVSALRGVDDDGNGLISKVELQRHTAEIQAQFEARFRLRSDGQAGVSALSWVTSPESDGSEPEHDFVVIMHRVNFARVPEHPELSTDLFGTRPGEKQFTITATHGTGAAHITEVAILEPAAHTRIFFRGHWTVFADFVRIGLSHILTGPDHLLFLLTIVVAAAGWKYWVGVVTTFTLAHSITLALSALGSIRVPASVVEPAIAGSIVIMACLNLYLARSAQRSATLGRIGVVFACGLLHGLGFGSAIGAMAVDTGNRIATLAGFNIGIEIGQFACVAVMLFLATVARRIVPGSPRATLATSTSIVAAVCGLAMLLSRVVPIADGG
jgi:hydrogenase/urease accessory protein HupE